jgi:hypothetical protein
MKRVMTQEHKILTISRFKLFKKLMTLPEPSIARHFEYCKSLRQLDENEEKWLISYYNRKSLGITLKKHGFNNKKY